MTNDRTSSQRRLWQRGRGLRRDTRWMLIILVLTCLCNLVADAAPIANITKADVSSSNVALAKLRGSLLQLASAQPTTAASSGLRTLADVVELVVRRRASLSTYEFCTSGVGLTRWIAEQRPDSVAALKRAQHDACARSSHYQLRHASSPVVLNSKDDGYGGILEYDPLYPPVTGAPGAKPEDGSCVVLSALVPSLGGTANVYDVASYKLFCRACSSRAS
jgi:hypothetical protein